LLIQVNGESRELPQQLSLEQLLNYLSLPGDRVAIELNQKVIRRAEWSAAVLQEGDQIEIVHFVGGGSVGVLASCDYWRSCAEYRHS
jgi:thiamine biosynthesis protein ThiS